MVQRVPAPTSTSQPRPLRSSQGLPWGATTGSWAARIGSEISKSSDLQSPVGRQHEAEPLEFNVISN